MVNRCQIIVDYFFFRKYSTDLEIRIVSRRQLKIPVVPKMTAGTHVVFQTKGSEKIFGKIMSVA
jgi:hypothetical protein